MYVVRRPRSASRRYIGHYSAPSPLRYAGMTLQSTTEYHHLRSSVVNHNYSKMFSREPQNCGHTCKMQPKNLGSRTSSIWLQYKTGSHHAPSSINSCTYRWVGRGTEAGWGWRTFVLCIHYWNYVATFVHIHKKHVVHFKWWYASWNRWHIRTRVHVLVVEGTQQKKVSSVARFHSILTLDDGEVAAAVQEDSRRGIVSTVHRVTLLMQQSMGRKEVESRHNTLCCCCRTESVALSNKTTTCTSTAVVADTAISWCGIWSVPSSGGMGMVRRLRYMYLLW